MRRTAEGKPRSRRARVWLLSAAAAIAALVLIGLCVPGLDGRARVSIWTSTTSGEVPSGRILRVACLGTGHERLPRALELQAERLAKHLQPVGIAGIEVVALDSYEALRTGFVQDELDVFIGSAYPGVRLARDTNARICLERASQNELDGRALWIVDAQSRVRVIADLKGKQVAFVDRWSMARSLFAVDALVEAGLTPGPACVERTVDTLPADVRFLFSGDVETSLLWLRRGRVEAIALEGTDVALQEISVDGTLRVIGRHSGELAPRDVVLTRLGLDPPIGRALTEELSRASALDPAGIVRFGPLQFEFAAQGLKQIQRWRALHARLDP